MKNLSRSLASALLGAAAMTLAVSAEAALITIDSVAANWTNVVTSQSGSTLNRVDSDGIAGDEEIRWGSARTQQSGYRFDGIAPPALSVPLDTRFSLGSFTHFNFVIDGESLRSARLELTVDLSVGGTPSREGPFLFSFLHDETANACSPLPGCANDLVSVSNLSSSNSFSVGGQLYTLAIDGFAVGGSIVSQFSTTEDRVNTAQLIGRFTTPVQVSAPAGLALFGLGLAALGVIRRRRSKAA